LIYHLGSGGVDEICALPHGLEKIRSDDAARVRRKGQVDAQDIACSGDFDQALPECNAHFSSDFRRQSPAPADDIHAEGVCARNHLASDPAQADQPDSASVQSACLTVLFLVPPADTQVRDVIGQATVQPE
jgi:hypothetical protein